jgi:hypothetical protein
MKSFKAYLTESTRTYDFKVRIAGDLTTEDVDKIKVALEQYKVVSVSKPKSSPIHETELFPNMGPVAINVMEVSVAYPARDDMIRAVINTGAGISADRIRVNGPDGAFESMLAGTEQSNQPTDAPVLETPDMKAAEVPKDFTGDARIPSLIKELEETKKYEYPEAAGGDTPAAQTTNELPVGELSAMGSTKPNIPDPMKMKAGNGK